MFTEEEKVMLIWLVRERAMFLREEQRKIDRMRVNIGRDDFMQKEYISYCSELISLHVLFTKLCHL
jgi:hypothetical protein